MHNPSAIRALSAVSALIAVGAFALLANTVARIREAAAGDILAAVFIAAGIYLVAAVLAGWLAAGLAREARHIDARADMSRMEEIAAIRAEIARSRRARLAMQRRGEDIRRAA